MIIVHGTFPIKHEVRDSALNLMREMASASRAEEGCITYEFYVGLSDPNVLLLFQEWASLEALQGHFETEHMEVFLKQLPGVLAGEVATRRYEVKVSSDDNFERVELEPDFVPQFEEREKIVH